MSIRHIALTYDNVDWNRTATDLVITLQPEWKDSDGPIEFVRFTDGITNTLLKAIKKKPGLSEHQTDQEAILLRAYGKGTDVLIDREREFSAHSLLASRGLAPPLLARFNNGLMYRFIEGDVCTPEDLRRPEVYKQVARRLGEWHANLPISAISSTPSEKTHLMNGTTGSNKLPTTDVQDRPAPNCWTVMQQWIDVLPEETATDIQRKKLIQQELTKLSVDLGSVPGLDADSAYVFAHCDLLSGNVIVRSQDPLCNGEPTNKERSVSFIDYEYATPAPAALDIANHFAEWAGFDCDHSAVPTASQRREFLEHYLASYRFHTNSEDDVLVKHKLNDELEQLFAQVDTFRGIPGFYWGIWALIQATISQIDFDYATYAELRLGEYWAWKAETDGSREREGGAKPLRERRWAEE